MGLEGRGRLVELKVGQVEHGVGRVRVNPSPRHLLSNLPILASFD